MIKKGISEELDQIRRVFHEGKEYIQRLKEREIENTNIPSLKISYNKVFGYYIEVPNAHKNKVPSEWIRKQTLTNAERYITEELKKYEDIVLSSEDKISQIELKIYMELVENISVYVSDIQRFAREIAKMDCLAGFASIARLYDYTKPTITADKKIEIVKGRHPVIERNMNFEESYVPNSIILDDENQQILIITGPNMAGKSAILRQIALITIMAQIGSFVPANSATIGVVDKIFSRVGASDNISKGESTFMVEMTETAAILNNLGENSLIIMDEIGRGTSTYDGISIAQSIVEYLHQSPKKPKTLFATHYHELSKLESYFERIKNYNVEVKEVEDKIVFLHTLSEGSSKHSFGINVAQMAGLPQKIISRSNDILDSFSQDSKKNKIKIKRDNTKYQLTFFDKDPKMEKLNQLLSNISVDNLSPIEALLKLNEIMKIYSIGN